MQQDPRDGSGEARWRLECSVIVAAQRHVLPAHVLEMLDKLAIEARAEAAE